MQIRINRPEESFEESLENFGLFRIMEETAAQDSLDLESAEKYYKSLKKNDG